MNSLVIARYKESLDWIAQVPSSFKVFIYNKGEKLEFPYLQNKSLTIVDRPNVGRESETYLYHLLTETADAEGFTAFSQGDPFTHSPDFIAILRNWESWDQIQPLAWQWREDKNIPPRGLLEKFQKKPSEPYRVRPEHFSLFTWCPLGFFDAGALNIETQYRETHKLPPGTNIASHFFGMLGMTALALKAEANSVGVFSYGAHFAVHNRLIHAFPKETFATLKKAILDATIHGYMMERLWLHLFGVDFLLPEGVGHPAPAQRALAG